MKEQASGGVPRVALLIETHRTYTREILAGIRRWIAMHGPWSTFLELDVIDSGPPAWLRNWDGDGILTRTFTKKTAETILETGLPAIELRATRFGHGLPFFGMDNQSIGKMVAEHFLERGYQDFAVYTLDSEAYFRQRVENFIETIKGRGYGCDVLPSRGERARKDWEEGQARLVSWLGKLPKPVGVFASNDQLGVRLLDACQRAGIMVPEEVAVVGCENEETLCEFASPRLSSVQFEGMEVGFRAAEALSRMMLGNRKDGEGELIPPRGIVVRESSDDLVITDQLVVRAVQQIRSEATGGLEVSELCDNLKVSRSTLERRMKQALGRTPKAEIMRVRFREVERLLRDTDFTIEVIAEEAGFLHSHYLQTAFKERYGVTPGAYRRDKNKNSGREMV